MSAALAGAAFGEALDRAVTRAGKAIAITEAASEGTRTVVRAAQELAERRKVDVRDLLIGDEIHDRALLNAAALQGEIRAGIDWSAIPGLAFAVGFEILRTAARIAALL